MSLSFYCVFVGFRLTLQPRPHSLNQEVVGLKVRGVPIRCGGGLGLDPAKVELVQVANHVQLNLGVLSWLSWQKNEMI